MEAGLDAELEGRDSVAVMCISGPCIPRWQAKFFRYCCVSVGPRFASEPRAIRHYVWLELPADTDTLSFERLVAVRRLGQVRTVCGVESGDRLFYQPSALPIGRPHVFIVHHGECSEL